MNFVENSDSAKIMQLADNRAASTRPRSSNYFLRNSEDSSGNDTKPMGNISGQNSEPVKNKLSPCAIAGIVTGSAAALVAAIVIPISGVCSCAIPPDSVAPPTAFTNYSGNDSARADSDSFDGDYVHDVIVPHDGYLEDNYDNYGPGRSRAPSVSDDHVYQPGDHVYQASAYGPVSAVSDDRVYEPEIHTSEPEINEVNSQQVSTSTPAPENWPAHEPWPLADRAHIVRVEESFPPIFVLSDGRRVQGVMDEIINTNPIVVPDQEQSELSPEPVVIPAVLSVPCINVFDLPITDLRPAHVQALDLSQSKAAVDAFLRNYSVPRNLRGPGTRDVQVASMAAVAEGWKGLAKNMDVEECPIFLNLSWMVLGCFMLSRFDQI